MTRGGQADVRPEASLAAESKGRSDDGYDLGHSYRTEEGDGSKDLPRRMTTCLSDQGIPGFASQRQ
jgi:hypothetical protein